ncbi:asparaginase domain-containing protein [Sulfurimonas sp.]|uniref:asparaginase domain-containing protein n=1 Tax=Sulfurimonas sp. TaxID=2022749 RepID=UPI0026249ACB|nr:asparaginase domain-containing protein [Sulfurimonas sp.]
MLILNCGGTFNKRYNQLTGELEVPYDNYAIEKILDSAYAEYDLAGVIYKDSLDMSVDDRKIIANIISQSSESDFLIVHGTDTMHLSAEFLDEVFDDRIIVLTGSMKPFEIDNIEATLNLGIAMGFLKSTTEYGVYICMNGYVERWDKIEKNRDIGKFEIVR